jgi:prevent-host-death family protein
MEKINIHEAKTNLSRLIAAVESGAEREIIIARNGRPAAKLTAVDAPTRRQIKFGVARGKFKLPDDFDADNDYIAKLFNGEVDD